MTDHGLRARIEALGPATERLRGDRRQPPELSVVIPVNAACDLEAVLDPLGDLARYHGPLRVEIVLSVNNYPADAEPPEIAWFAAAGHVVVATPAIFTLGQSVCFSARLPGVDAAACDLLVCFDADCRIPDPTALLDWYAAALAEVPLAYTPVRYHDLLGTAPVRVLVAAHHVSRWCKRNLLRVPTVRGSNYGVRRGELLSLVERRLISADFNLGPTFRARGWTVRYGRGRALVTSTSGRRYDETWWDVAKYLRYRLLFNVRNLPVRTIDQRASEHRYYTRANR